MTTPSLADAADSNECVLADLPSKLPGTILPLASALCEALDTPREQRDRIQRISDALPALGIQSLGIESDIDDPDLKVDFSVGVDVTRSSIAELTHEPDLAALALAAVAHGCASMWWEFDTSKDAVTEGAFVSVNDRVDGWALLDGALANRPDLRTAAGLVREALGDIVSRGLVGAFPSRPATAALATLDPSEIPGALRTLQAKGVAAPAPDDPMLMRLLEQVDQAAISCGAHPSGRIVAGVEIAFDDRVAAMVDRRWTPVLTDASMWSGERLARLATFLRIQGAHAFAGVLPMVFFSGIDHVKLSPHPTGTRIKVYAGGSLVMMDSGTTSGEGTP